MHVIERAGGGPVAVCIHGFCQSSLFWAPFLDGLAAAGIGGVAPDLPGFGRSAAGAGPWTMEAYADAVAGMLAGRGLAQVDVIGGSMGGVVAQQMALRHPGLVRRLVLVATGAFTADPAAGMARAAQLETSEWDAAGMVSGFFHRQPDAASAEAYRRVVGMADRTAAVAAARANAMGRTFERLGEIRAPTLVVAGRHDKARTVAHAAEMAGRIADARMVVMEESGHTPQIEETAALLQVVVGFLRG